jgi:ribosomal 50S subunit-associated protein YjgA (DUF615 family)
MRQAFRKGVTMRLLRWAMVSLVLLSTPAQAWEWRWPWASADESANKLFVEAVPLWNQYQALPEEDPAQYEARLQLLNQIDENLKSILKDYPESLLAVELVSTGALKQLDKEQIEAEIPRLQQSIPAAALLAEMLPLGQQYQALPQNDPAQYEARLKLITQIDANLEKLLKDYPLSYEAGTLENGAADLKREANRLQQSIPASALMAEAQPLWEQYQGLPNDDPAQYEARLKLLTQVDVNLDKLLKDYPQSYEAENLSIDTISIKVEIQLLQQSIPASVLMAETSPLWEQYQTLPTDDPAQYEARLKLLTQVDGNLDTLLKDYPLSYEASELDIDASDISIAILSLKVEIQRLACASDTQCLLQLAWSTAELINSETDRASALIAIASGQAAAGDVEGAMKTAELINSATDRANAFTGIASGQAAAGDVEGALKTAELINSETDRASAFSAIANAQAATGDVEGALKTVEAISEQFYRMEALIAIVGAQAAAGDVEGALKTAELTIKSPTNRASALIAIAGAQAAAGDVEGALKTVELTIKSPTNRASALIAIAGAQAAAGDVEGALKTVELTIKSPTNRASAFSAIAGAQAASGDVEGALKTAELINFPTNRMSALNQMPYRSSAFLAIASAQAVAEDVEGALKTTDLITSAVDRANAFAAIAGAQAAAGDVVAALKTAEGIDDLLARTNAFVGVAKAAAKLK